LGVKIAAVTKHAKRILATSDPGSRKVRGLSL